MLELASGEFVKRQDNLAFVGQSGLGKSHLIQGIARACCVLGYLMRLAPSRLVELDKNSCSAKLHLPCDSNREVITFEKV